MVSAQYIKKPGMALVFALALSAGLSACGGEPAPAAPASPMAPANAPLGTDVGTTLMGEHESSGFVIADEPTAVFVARSVLEQGGFAGDAAAALYYTLAVTYPVAAGLGGGGVCLHYDAERGQASSIDFLPREARAGGALAVPGNVRGFALIQARFGRLPASTVMAPAQRLAALGYSVSRALATELQANAAIVRRDPMLAALFVNPDGSLRGEGERITQTELAATLGLISAKGPHGFYAGTLAHDIVSESTKSGGAISPDDLYDNRATVTEANMTPRGGRALITPASHTGAGALFDEFLPQAVLASAQADSAGTTELATRVRAALKTALATFRVGELPTSVGSTGFVVADRMGDVILCGLTMGRPFGVAAARRTGFSFAPTPHRGPAGIAGAFLLPVLVTASKGGEVLFAGVGAGGRDSAVAVTTLALQAASGGLASLKEAVGASRGAGGHDQRTRLSAGARRRPGKLRAQRRSAGPWSCRARQLARRRRKDPRRLLMRISRRSAIAPFLVMDMFARAKERVAAGESISRLEAGEPSGPPPEVVRKAVARALDRERLGYTEPLGLAALRARIARFYGERYGIDLSPERVIVTAGASGAFLLAFLALFDAGARVGVTEPGYPAYRNILELLDIAPVTLSASADTRFQPTAEMVGRALPAGRLYPAEPRQSDGHDAVEDGARPLAARARDGRPHAHRGRDLSRHYV